MHALHYQPETQEIICSSDWDINHYPVIQAEIDKLQLPRVQEVTLNGQAIKRLDSAGALLLVHLQKKCQRQNKVVHFSSFSTQAQTLLGIVQDNVLQGEGTPQPAKKKHSLGRVKPGFLALTGKKTQDLLSELRAFLSFVGYLTEEMMRLLRYPALWRWRSLAAVIASTGVQALPIIALLSFLIGVVLTYQMGLQLKNYGADIYIVDLLGLSILREFGPLITAIMVSGRTGSAFTASLGMMKLNQEIDALNTMGVTPAELLLLPRILGLLIALPLLTMWSDIFGLLGGMMMSKNMLDIGWHEFLPRFQQVIPLKTFMLGIGKTPVFALIIATIGCHEGMRVKHSADSVGENTTKSVVLSIFFIIVADAAFSILFSKLQL